mmetsp:Transcript_5824/g.16323  ORF Transcript_5824/g.16323 Transcript_5824/m.16323 type:complete len:236 (+) Transcript_5824:361-1068(+)
MNQTPDSKLLFMTFNKSLILFSTRDLASFVLSLSLARSCRSFRLLVRMSSWWRLPHAHRLKCWNSLLRRAPGASFWEPSTLARFKLSPLGVSMGVGGCGCYSCSRPVSFVLSSACALLLSDWRCGAALRFMEPKVSQSNSGTLSSLVAPQIRRLSNFFLISKDEARFGLKSRVRLTNSRISFRLRNCSGPPSLCGDKTTVPLSVSLSQPNSFRIAVICSLPLRIVRSFGGKSLRP